MAIDRVKCRALVKVGGLEVDTPYVQSFTVNKRRGQVSTFDASLKVSHDRVSGSITGDNVKIWAGENDANDLIFTGMVKQAKISPCYDDPKYVILSISGADPLSLLSGKKFTRRCRATKTAWVGITGVARRGLKSGKFAYQKESRFHTNHGDLNREANVTGYSPGNAAKTTKPSAAPANVNPGSSQLHVQVVEPDEEGVN